MKKTWSAVILGVLIVIFWIILSFRLDLTTVIIGAMVSLLVVFFNLDLIFNKAEASRLSWHVIKHVVILFFVLIFNIIKSNIHVAKIVLSKDMPIDPGFVEIKNPLGKTLNQALFANAITLTPGTLTVDMDQDTIVVHGLEKDHVRHLDESTLEKAFVALEEVPGHD